MVKDQDYVRVDDGSTQHDYHNIRGRLPKESYIDSRHSEGTEGRNRSHSATPICDMQTMQRSAVVLNTKS